MKKNKQEKRVESKCTKWRKKSNLKWTLNDKKGNFKGH